MQTYLHTYCTYIEGDRHASTDRQRERDSQTSTDRQRQRQTTERVTDKQAQTDRERQTGRHRQTRTDRQAQTDRGAFEFIEGELTYSSLGKYSEFSSLKFYWCANIIQF